MSRPCQYNPTSFDHHACYHGPIPSSSAATVIIRSVPRARVWRCSNSVTLGDCTHSCGTAGPIKVGRGRGIVELRSCVVDASVCDEEGE